MRLFRSRLNADECGFRCECTLYTLQNGVALVSQSALRDVSSLNMGNGQPDEPVLIVLRGNSGSGKSATANELRRHYGRGVAIVSQDLIRRIVLKERDTPNGATIGLIDLTARHALAHGFHAIVEGILYADHYGEMLRGLYRDYPDRAHFYYFDVSFEESLRRHATKPNAHEFGEREMGEWFRPRDLLPGVPETVIPEMSTLDETVSLILGDTRILDRGPASTI